MEMSKAMSMMAGTPGYRNIANFSDDSVMRDEYYGLIARGDRFYLAKYVNVNEGYHRKVELTKKEAMKIQHDFARGDYSMKFIETWINRLI